MLARLRVSVPDRPGTLGLVASAVGAASGDIVRLEVLDSEAGRALDDVFVEVRDAAHLDRVAERVGAVRGVSVEGLQRPAPPAAGHAELELAAAVVARPDDALRTAVDGLPGTIGADWAALLRWGADGAPVAVLGASTGCPGVEPGDLGGALRLRAVTARWGDGALLPVEPGVLGLLVVRSAGPSFHRSELWRLGQLGELTGAAARLRRDARA